MEKFVLGFRKFANLINKAGFIFWIIGMLFKTFALWSEEIENKWGKKVKGERSKINNPFNQIVENGDKEAE